MRERNKPGGGICYFHGNAVANCNYFWWWRWWWWGSLVYRTKGFCMLHSDVWISKRKLCIHKSIVDIHNTQLSHHVPSSEPVPFLPSLLSNRSSPPRSAQRVNQWCWITTADALKSKYVMNCIWCHVIRCVLEPLYLLHLWSLHLSYLILTSDV